MNFFDCFAGIGGFHFAAKAVFGRELRPVGHCENDRVANACYEAVTKRVRSSRPYLSIGDLTELTRTGSGKLRSVSAIRSDLPKHARRIDLFTAGFPCQPHSLMGNRKGLTDSRGEIAYDMLKLIAAMDAQAVVLENVRAIRSVNGGEFFESVLRRLGRNYDVRWMELNASDFCVPQTRRRLFIIATRNSAEIQPPPPRPIACARFPTTWHLLERSVGPRYYLSEQIKKTILRDEHKGYRRKAEINKLLARPLTRTMHKMHRASQDNYYSDAFIQGRFDEGTSSVVLHREGHDCIRKITPLEAFRIQAFPESAASRWLSLGFPDSRYYMAAGNAVPPPLAEVVLELVACHALN